jgi:hypothetical protein
LRCFDHASFDWRPTNEGEATMRPGRELAAKVGAIDFQNVVISHWTSKCREILQDRKNLPRDDLEYVVETIAKLKDERLKACVAELIGWGDDERAELETFCAIALEVMKMSSPSRLREAALRVELRYLTKDQPT